MKTAAMLARLFALFGWALVLVVVFLLSGCADEAQTWAADQASLADAIAQAAKGDIHE